MAKKEIGIEVLNHKQAKRKNIPTAEFESVMQAEDKSPIRIAYERRNRDLDPQLVWRGKDEQDWSDLVVQAPPLYIQEKVHPKVLIDDLMRQSKERAADKSSVLPDLFADFNGLPNKAAQTEFYKHDAHWSNRMILGDSLAVMASLAEREGLRGQVQCIYIDPPYGIKFNSNFQWSTTSRGVKDGNRDHITREPEQVRAFRDTWKDGIHSYLTFLRDRLLVARDLLTDSGSVFVQIGETNVHLVRGLLDEIFGQSNFVSLITVKKTAGQDQELLNNVADYVLWYCKQIAQVKFRRIFAEKSLSFDELGPYSRVQLPDGTRRGITSSDRKSFDHPSEVGKVFRIDQTSSSGHGGNTVFPFQFRKRSYLPSTNRHWSTHAEGMKRLDLADRLVGSESNLSYVRFFEDFRNIQMGNIWEDTSVGGFTDAKIYVVQTVSKIVERCLLMATDPGDLVLDPTCGSGTTAYVAEQWGRRWITIDTSRVALALARARIMGARYPYYLLADSREGQLKEGEVTCAPPKEAPVRGDIRHGFVYERVPHITLKSIANNAEIDVIWDKWQKKLEPLRQNLNAALKAKWDEWEIPREADDVWSAEAKELHTRWWEARIARQKEVDASIAAKADFEYLYDRPYADNSRIRVAGPFTVESLSPHRTMAVDEGGGLVDLAAAKERDYDPDGAPVRDFAQMVLENLKAAGVHQAHKADRIAFTALTGWPGEYICAEGRFMEGETERRAGIFIGPEFGTVSRPDLVAAVREAGDAGFDVVIACAFNYDAHSSEFEKLGRVRVLKARMNPELHMAGELKATGSGNLFVVFGEPDIRILKAEGADIQVKI
jgi:adenine-specific DNA-methyltransferase